MTVGQVVTALLLFYITFKLRAYVQACCTQSSPAQELSELESPRPSTRRVRATSSPMPPAGTERLRVLLRRVQCSAYWMLFNTVAFVMTVSPTFSTPEGFVATNAFIFLGTHMVSLLHILAYGRTPPFARRSTATRKTCPSSKVSVGSQNKIAEALESKEDKIENSSTELSKTTKHQKQLSVVVPIDQLSVLVSSFETPVSKDSPCKRVSASAVLPSPSSEQEEDEEEGGGGGGGGAMRKGLREGLLGEEPNVHKSRSSHDPLPRTSLKAKSLHLPHHVHVVGEGEQKKKEEAVEGDEHRPKHKHKPSENYEPLSDL